MLDISGSQNSDVLAAPLTASKDLISFMSFVKNFRQRRASARANRVMERAITSAPSPALRDELIIAAQRAGLR